ncbi:MAG TPA: hypothetical protein VN711_01355 [Candidatus Saccharimonadales bacterium]|nr:hypothetical protein [Candidatus Saccharimonadales bacterium]
MKAEQIILSLFAVVIGLIVAGAAFFIYQSTRTISPSSLKTINVTAPTPTSGPSIPLSVDSPQDESVVTSKIVTVSGKTDPSATVMVETSSDDTVVQPSSAGAFSLTITLPDSENTILVTAIGKDGSEVQKTLTVAYETQDF